MLKLHARFTPIWDADPIIARVTTSPDRPESARPREALLAQSPEPQAGRGFAARLTFGEALPPTGTTPVVQLPEAFRYIADGDIVRIIPRTGEIVTIYRKRSGSNAIFTTERCNSNCIMCSQPPREID